MAGLLQGKRGLITGPLDDKSIAWKVAETAHQQGAQLVLTNAPVAKRMGALDTLGEKIAAPIFYADLTQDEDVRKLVDDSTNALQGPLDFVLHSVGMSPNVRKKRGYTELNYDFLHKTLDISAISLHRLLQTCWDRDAIAENGSVLALSYIAAQRVFPYYNDMAEAKAMLESIVRSFGYHYGQRKGVRINAVSQSPTMTTAGSGIKGFDGFFDFAEKMSPLGNASAQECADYCVMLFSDFARKVTMQTLFHDGGFSNTGIGEEMMHLFSSQVTPPEEAAPQRQDDPSPS